MIDHEHAFGGGVATTTPVISCVPEEENEGHANCPLPQQCDRAEEQIRFHNSCQPLQISEPTNVSESVARYDRCFLHPSTVINNVSGC